MMRLFNLNNNGFVKRKEMMILKKNDIFGLNASQTDVSSNPVFDVLYGEVLVKHYEKQITCEHNFQPQYLKRSSSKSFTKCFKSLPGQLVITNFRLLIVPKLDNLDLQRAYHKQPNFVREFFNIPIGMISRVEHSINIQLDSSKGQKYNYNQQGQNFIEIHTKDNRYFKLTFFQLNALDCHEIWAQLDALTFIDGEEKKSISLLPNSFLFNHYIDINDNNWTRYVDGWRMYESIEADVARMGIDLSTSEHFRLFDNSNYSVCKTYPAKFIVPQKLADSVVVECSNFRTKNRLPAMSYYHRKTGCSIWRSSQCMNGRFNKRNVGDESMLIEIGKTANNNQTLINNNRVMIYDARPKLNAQAQMYIKNGGFEDVKAYRNCDLVFCDIDNIHEVTKTFRKMFDICLAPDSFNTIANYGPLLEATGYLQMISRILKAANMVVESMIQKRNNVLVHCSDGWDRTAQMSALAQQLVDPYYRTLPGFIVLVCKDWISFGHQFHLRFGQYDRNYKEEQRSPVFLQYLDCVRQLMIQFPLHFEYNQELLLFLAEEVHTHKYGTFLGNCDQQREHLQIKDKTESIWTYIMLERPRFMNKFYSPDTTQGIIQFVPITAPWALQEWREYFYKWSNIGHRQLNQNETQSFYENNTDQAVAYQTNRDLKAELTILLQKQIAVLIRLEQ